MLVEWTTLGWLNQLIQRIQDPSKIDKKLEISHIIILSAKDKLYEQN